MNLPGVKTRFCSDGTKMNGCRGQACAKEQHVFHEVTVFKKLLIYKKIQDWINYDCQEIILNLMVKCKLIFDALSVDFLSRLFGN